MQNKMSLPFSVALYETDATCVTFHILQTMRHFANLELSVADEITTHTTYKSNAIIQNVQKDLRYQRIECVAEIDFSNMYATMIAIFNLSPELVVFKG